MNKIQSDELYGNVKQFLKEKGVELQDGSYTRRLQKGCDLLAATVNRSQAALARARTAMDNGLDKVRQTIHEKTAPKPPAAAPTPGPAAQPEAPPVITPLEGAKVKPGKAQARRPRPSPSKPEPAKARVRSRRARGK